MTWVTYVHIYIHLHLFMSLFVLFLVPEKFHFRCVRNHSDTSFHLLFTTELDCGLINKLLLYQILMFAAGITGCRISLVFVCFLRPQTSPSSQTFVITEVFELVIHLR